MRRAPCALAPGVAFGLATLGFTVVAFVALGIVVVIGLGSLVANAIGDLL